jgi:enoyl-CoA hydratase/carnithine racemase
MSGEVVTEKRGAVGFITLNRPRAVNALSLTMIRELTATLLAWRDDASIEAVAIRGNGKEGPFGAFCAGGDIRFFHQAVLAGNPELEDFFTEEYTLVHLVFKYPKPFVAFMDGIVMGGGMGLSQGASLRIVTERTRMAMPETNIGLFPDVAGGYFLGRCPGRIGDYLALTGEVIGGADAQALPGLWQGLAAQGPGVLASLRATQGPTAASPLAQAREEIDRFFSLSGVPAIIAALESDSSPWAAATAAMLRKRSPLMLRVVAEQMRRGRRLGLADELRMERNMVRHCFHLRPGVAGETMEGIRALAVDKDQNPKWNPPRIEDVTPEMVDAFFVSPWPAHAHPLRDLA